MRRAVFSATASLLIIANFLTTVGAGRVGGLRERRRPKDAPDSNNGDDAAVPKHQARTTTRLLKNDAAEQARPKNEEDGSGSPNSDHAAIVPKIVDGDLAAQNEFPWFTQIETTSFGIYDSHHCGGSLVSPQFVLCAAHCLDGADQATVGAYANRWDNGGAKSRERTIARKVAHPKYNARTLNNDFALLKLSKPVTDIPTIPLSNKNLSPGDRLVVMGLGRTDDKGPLPTYLQKVELEYVSDASCGWSYWNNGGITDSMMCAGDPDKTDSDRQDSCFGDSGGPLVTRDEGSGEVSQVGVVSFGKGCGTNTPGVYAKVGAVMGWIEETICELSDDDAAPKPDFCENYAAPPPAESTCRDKVGFEDHCRGIEESWWNKAKCFQDWLFDGHCDATCGRCP